MAKMFYMDPAADYKTLGRIIDNLWDTMTSLDNLLDTIPDTPENLATRETIWDASSDIDNQIRLLEEVRGNIVDREGDDYEQTAPVQVQQTEDDDSWLRNFFKADGEQNATE